MPWSNILADLSADEHYYSALFGLTGLNDEKLQQFFSRWNELTPERRREAAQGMVEIAEEHVELDFGQVFRLLTKDSDPEVRASAASGLWEDKDKQDIELLLDMMQNDAQPSVRAAAASALGNAASQAEMDELDPVQAGRLISALLEAYTNDQDFEVRQRALESVSYVSAAPIPDLIRAAYDSTELRLKVAAIFAMGRSCLPQWQEIIAKELASSEPEIRFEAVRAAGEMEDEELVWPVARLIADEDEEVRLQAVDALGKIGGDLAERTLLGLAESGDDAVREAAVDALEWLKSFKDPLNFGFGLRDLLGDDDEEDVGLDGEGYPSKPSLN
jgi:HEAT repeat protein